MLAEEVKEYGLCKWVPGINSSSKGQQKEEGKKAQMNERYIKENNPGQSNQSRKKKKKKQG